MPESSLPAPGAQPGAAEDDRRIWFRFPSRRATYCQSAGSDVESGWPAQACDVSRGGLKLLSTRKFERGATLKIGSINESAGNPSMVIAQVRYVTPTPDGKWILGCAFLKELTEEELLTWLKKQE
jgi:hypothetical protein